MEMHAPGASKRRKRGRGKVGRDVCAWMAGRVEFARSLLAARVRVHHLAVASLVFLLLVFVLTSESPPTSIATYYQPPAPCSSSPYLSESAYCTGECNAECFPRVRNICFASDKVRLCDDAAGRRSDVPKFMRFFGEKLTVRVERFARCDEGWHWVSGLSLVMDQRWLPAGKPNPHHEAEKLVPALLLKAFLNGSANLQWFAAKTDVSRWGQGLLAAFDLTGHVRYHDLPTHKDDSICFKDAVLFSAPTHVRYVNRATNSWLRSQVLEYCKISPRNASWPIRRAVVLDRSSGPRNLANKLDAGTTMEKLLVAPVEHRSSGIGSFCEQVRSVAEDDFFLVPHGSQNVNFLFARPGAVVIEVFPYLYHTDAFRNFTYAAGVEVLPLLGARPGGLWIRVAALLGWDGCFRWRPCKNYARSQSLEVDLEELEKVIRRVQKQRSPSRGELGW